MENLMPTRSSKTILLATDQQRSVLSALDWNRSNVIAYAPYGYRPLGNGLLSLLGFNGELPDLVTGHYHLGKGYRQFNPVLMRFNSPDSWSPFEEGGINAFAYCAGNPVNTFDPTGHTLEFLKPILRTLGLMDPSIIKQTQQQLAIAQANTLENIHKVFLRGKTPRKIYLSQLESEHYSQIHNRALANNPEFSALPSNTLTRPELAQASRARQQYSYNVMEHVSNRPPSPVGQKTQTVTFTHDPQPTLVVDRAVPTPVNGWRTRSDARLKKRSTLWSRRIRQ